jgi:hypothetical protein
MTHSVFTVSHSLVGWLVCKGDRIAEVFSSRFWAQKGAGALAYERHVDTGQPAIVVLTYPSGASCVAHRFESAEPPHQ